MNRASRWVMYWSIVIAVTAAIIALTLSSMFTLFWFGICPIVCVAFLYLAKAEVSLSLRQLVTDTKHYWKFVVYIGIYEMIAGILNAYLVRPHYSGNVQVCLPSYAIARLSNVIEELFFRSTFISGLEQLERKLFDQISQRRVVALSSASFAMMHLHYVLRSTHSLVRYGSMVNIVFAFLVGLLLGTVYWRSRNLLSTVVFHWWINFQSEAFRYLGLLLFM